METADEQRPEEGIAMMIRLASLIVNAIAIVGGGWLLLAVFAACYKFY